MNKYILDENGQPVLTENILEWAEWNETNRAQRIVERTEVLPGVEVSTVFLGIDHNWIGEGPPILWETMIFAKKDHPLNQQQMRHSSITDARAGHDLMCQRVRNTKEDQG